METKAIVIIVALLVIALFGWMAYFWANLSANICYQSYTSLKEDLEKSKAIAKSAEWLSNDERLKVRSEVIKKTGYYVIKVSVTNVSNEPIKQVYLLLITRSKDGELDYIVKEIKDLYIGETGSEEFWMTEYEFEDLESYKVFAIGS